MGKVLLVTDYAGTLHVTPTGNKAFYEGRNNAVKGRQFKFKEMEEEEANKYVEENKGSDPEYVAPGKAGEALADKDAQIAKLQAELAAIKGGAIPQGQQQGQHGYPQGQQQHDVTQQPAEKLQPSGAQGGKVSGQTTGNPLQQPDPRIQGDPANPSGQQAQAAAQNKGTKQG